MTHHGGGIHEIRVVHELHCAVNKIQVVINSILEAAEKEIGEM